MQFHTYLTFDDRCEEAFEFYRECLGGELFLQTNGDSPMRDQIPPERHGKILHASLTLKDALLMGSDAPPQWREPMQGFAVSIKVDDVAEAERVFAALSAGGTVKMELAETFWAQRFGMLVDRFGTPWMVNCDLPAGASASAG